MHVCSILFSLFVLTIFCALQKQLYSLVVKISELLDTVKSKRVELALLKEAKALSAVLDTQVRLLFLHVDICFYALVSQLMLWMDGGSIEDLGLTIEWDCIYL